MSACAATQCDGAGLFYGLCPRHLGVCARLKQIAAGLHRGVVTDAPCARSCRVASSLSCECSCGGLNHGRGAAEALGLTPEFIAALPGEECVICGGDGAPQPGWMCRACWDGVDGYR